MKRTAALIAIAGMLVAAPSAMAASSAVYSGQVAGGGDVSLKVRTTKKKTPKGKMRKKTTLVRFAYERLPIECGTQARSTSGGVSNYRAPVRKGRFRIRATLGDPVNPAYSQVIRGEIADGGAAGTIEVLGSQVPLDDGWGSADCSSGPVAWSAAR